MDEEYVEEEETVKLEKIINMTFGTNDNNVVNFRLLQTILHILAHRMNMLDQDVDIRLEERDELITALKAVLHEGYFEPGLESDDESSEIEIPEKGKRSGDASASDEGIGGDIESKKGKAKGEKQTAAGKAALSKPEKGKAKTDKSEKGSATIDKTEMGKATTDKSDKGKATIDKSEKGKATTDKSEKGKATIDKSDKGKATTDKSEKGKAATEKLEKGKAATDESEKGKAATDKSEKAKTTTDKSEKGKATTDKSEKDKAKQTDKIGGTPTKGTTGQSASGDSEDEGEKKDGKKSDKKGGKAKKGVTDGDTSPLDVSEDEEVSKDKKGKMSEKGETAKEKKGKKSKKSGAADDSLEEDVDVKKDRTKKGDESGEDGGDEEGGTKKDEDQQDDVEHDGKSKGKKGHKGKEGAGKGAAETKQKAGGRAAAGTAGPVGKGAKGQKDTVGKGTMTRGSIELVTRSQFEVLQKQVTKLKQKNAPYPLPSMPDNLMIKEALSKGTTTLSGSMEAMQLNARVKAAEQALTRMTDLLSNLAAAGAFPPNMSGMLDQLLKEREELGHLMEAGDKVIKPKGAKQMQSGMSLRLGQSRHAGMPSTISMVASGILQPIDPLVSPPALSEAMENMKYEMLQNMVNLTDKSTAAVNQATGLVKTVATKLRIALGVNKRMSELDEITAKHAKQLSGFDAGLTDQLAKFKTEIETMQQRLTDGLGAIALDKKLESVAVAQLKEGQERMELIVDEARYHIHSLFVLHKHLHAESVNVKQSVEMVNLEKVSRDDLKRGLEEKVDLNRLVGLLKDEDFEVSRKDLNEQLDTCFQKFTKLDNSWMDVIRAQSRSMTCKAPLLDLFILKDFTTGHLKDIQAMLDRLEIVMGDPKVAKLTRDLSRTAYCASCMIGAHMAPYDRNYGKPPQLPALILDYFGKESVHEINLLKPPDHRDHISRRWTGGSHTIITQRTITPRSPLAQFEETPTKRYAAICDGHVYMMEEELQPCAECQVDDEDPEKATNDSDADREAEEQKYMEENASIISIVGSSLLNRSILHHED